MAINIGHASIDERGKANSGSAGDQNAKEVCVRSYYTNNWKLVIRAKDPAVAEAMAKACEAGCANDKIGYDQYQRNTLNTQAAKVGYDLSKIKTACETDCSAFMTVCAWAAGVQVPYNGTNAPTTSTMRSAFSSTGMFDILTGGDYLNSDAYLQRGDILVKPGYHTVMALGNGSKVKQTATTTATTSGKIDTVKEVQAWLNSTFGSGLDVDGEYGKLTKTALVKALQNTVGVTEDGIYGTKTNAAVTVVKQGSKGMLVKVLQGFLVCHGHASAYVDGDCGAGTVAAIKAVQESYGLKADGIAGKKTFKALCS